MRILRGSIKQTIKKLGLSAVIRSLALAAALGVVCLVTTSAASQDLTADDVLVDVREVIINQSEILTEGEITAIVDPMIGQRMSMEQLQEVLDQINRLYDEKQFITARAVLPPQTIEHGVVRIQLVEGRVGDITVADNQATKEAYFLNWISLQPGDLVRLDVLEQDLLYFNATNDVQVRARSRRAKEFGQTDLMITAVEPPKYQVVALLTTADGKKRGFTVWELLL